jgi:hypothetical protein
MCYFQNENEHWKYRIRPSETCFFPESIDQPNAK